jgi:hypothetical protein
VVKAVWIANVLPLLFQIADEDGVTVEIDEIVNALVTITTSHHEVHEGEMFVSTYFIETLADNAKLEMLLRAGANECHLFWAAAAGGNATLEIIDRVTVTDPGMALSEENLHRASGNLPLATTFHTPTVAAGDTILGPVLLPGGTGGNSSGGILRTDTEIIVAANSDIYFDLTNIAGNNQPASLLIEWYEEEPL